MRLITRMYILMYCCVTLVPVACSRDELPVASGEGKAVISLTLRASSAGINEDTQLWEDRVDEVRMLIFDQDGKMVRNMRLNFPDGFSLRSEAIIIDPGVYDFYFIANESVFAGDFTDALAAVSGQSDFLTDPRFSSLRYAPEFIPDGSTPGGRFLMSARYNNISVEAGGTPEDPEPLSLPTRQVQLIRSLAKVEIVFRKRTPGSNVPDGMITSVQVQHVAQNISVPPVDSYYAGQSYSSARIMPSGFDYTRDSIGSVIFYIPEFLRKASSSGYTELHINNKVFPVYSDKEKSGLIDQRRNISSLSDYSVIRNYHYQIDAYIDTQGGVQLKICVSPWSKAVYTYMFQDEEQTIVVPPVTPTDSSVIVPTQCGKIEIRSINESLSQGLQGAYNEQILWWDQATQGPKIVKGKAPYYCEKKYGKGWRLINTCELMSFLALFDQTYRVWQSNTWQGINSKLPVFPVAFRLQAQELLGKLTGVDMSRFTPVETRGGDAFGGEKLGMIDDFFTPGDIMATLNDYPDGWPFPAPPFSGIENWFPMEVVQQVKAYWYSGYLKYDDPANYNKILYQRFERYNFSSTISRCVRVVE